MATKIRQVLLVIEFMLRTILGIAFIASGVTRIWSSGVDEIALIYIGLSLAVLRHPICILRDK